MNKFSQLSKIAVVKECRKSNRRRSSSEEEVECTTGCKKTSVGEIVQGGDCPWDGYPPKKKKDCSCYEPGVK